MVGMLRPLVSVVTPAYNAERYIEDTLKSIRNQTYPNIEHIVIDDGSTDCTSEVLAKYEKLYNLKWFSKANEGQAATVNQAFKKAKGEIIIWLNADDVLFSVDVITDVVRKFNATNVGVVYGHMAIIDEQNRLLKIQYAPPRLNSDILKFGHFAACVFYRKKVVLSNPVKPEYKYVLDYEQCLRMAKHGVKFGYIDKPLLAWRKHSLTKSISGHKKMQNEARFVRKDYNTKSDFKHRLMKLAYFSLLMSRKACGLKTVIELYSRPKQSNPAFDIQFGSLLYLATRQAVPFA